MLDIGLPELLIVALVTIMVVGPKELPRVLRTVTQLVRKVRSMASEFQSGIDDLAREAELDELKNSIEKTASTDLAGELESQIDPTGEVTESVREIESSVNEDPHKSGENEGPMAPEELTESFKEASPLAADESEETPAEDKKKAGGSA